MCSKKIYLSGRHSDLFVLVDDEDYDRLNQYKWYLDSKWGYAKNVKDMINLEKSTLMHRIIMNVKDQSILVDHINRNPLDNRKENLRLCSVKENTRNVKPIKNATSQYKGVRWDVDKKLFRAVLTSNHIMIHGGYFVDEILAAKRYDQLAREHHGSFACLNFPDIDNYLDVDKYLESIKKEIDSKYLGVCKNKDSKINPWKASLLVTEIIGNSKKKRTINIGIFTNPIDAAIAYDKCLFQHRHLRKRKPIYNFPELING